MKLTYEESVVYCVDNAPASCYSRLWSLEDFLNLYPHPDDIPADLPDSRLDATFKDGNWVNFNGEPVDIVVPEGYILKLADDPIEGHSLIFARPDKINGLKDVDSTIKFTCIDDCIVTDPPIEQEMTSIAMTTDFDICPNGVLVDDLCVV